MAGIFERANNAVILSLGDRIEYGPTKSVAVPEAVPTASDEGEALRGSPTAILVAKPSAGETLDIEVYLYLNATLGWQLFRNGTFAAITDKGFVERINVGGFERVFIRATSVGSNPASITVGRAIL